MIEAVIVEDEQGTIEVIKDMLALFCPEVKVLGAAKSVGAAKVLILEKKPQLVFLDIQLKGGNGFQLLKEFQELPFKVIFITAFDNYAVKAFKYSAVDYLLKPIDPDELVDSIERISSNVERNSLPLQTLQKNVKSLENILLKTQESYHVVKIAEIIYCQSEGNYTTFFIKNGRKILVSKPLKYYTQLLAGREFYRIHQSYLINMKSIVRYDKTGYVYLEENHHAPVASRRTEYFLKLLNEFGGIS
ncbi:MAG: LytR/AlgR family response regulator transcription factor [Chitinophagales bacterium]